MLLLEGIEGSKRIKTSLSNNKDIDFQMSNLNETSNINFEYTSIKRTYLLEQYNAICKQDLYLINEANVNFISGMINILGKFKELVEELYNKFINFLKKMRDAFLYYINREKINIDRIKNTDLEFEGFNYKLKHVPFTNLNRLTKNGDFSFNNAHIGLITADYVREVQRITKSEYYYDEIRGSILGTKKIIRKEEFSNEIKKCFRNGKLKPEKMKFDNYKTVRELYDDIINYHTTLKEITEQRNSTKREYDILIKYFQNLIDVRVIADRQSKKPKEEYCIGEIKFNGNEIKDYKQSEYKTLTETKVDLIRKYGIARADEAKRMSQMITDVFVGKIEAVKERYQQDNELMKKLIRMN